VSRARQICLLLLPTVIVGCAVGLSVHEQFRLHGDANGLIHFGSYFAPFTHPPKNAITGGKYGYDGQWYWVLAHDPLLLHKSTLAHLQFQRFRAQRIAYPAMSYVVAQVLSLPTATAMLLVNVGLVIGSTFAFSWYALRRGWSPLWGLAVGLLPGLLLPTLYDLTDPLATLALAGGLIGWSRGSRRWAPLALVVAVLAREITVLVVIAIGIEALFRAWTQRQEPGALGRIARDTWPGVVLPAAAFLAWHFYIETVAVGHIGNAASTLPFDSFIRGWNRALHLHGTMKIWDVAFEVIMCTASAVALISIWWDRSALSLMAALTVFGMGIADYGVLQGDTRDSAPLFLLLLAVGLERRSWWRLAPCAAAAAMTLLLPLLVPEIFSGQALL
jgi:hypothetical protein